MASGSSKHGARAYIANVAAIYLLLQTVVGCGFASSSVTSGSSADESAGADAAGDGKRWAYKADSAMTSADAAPGADMSASETSSWYGPDWGAASADDAGEPGDASAMADMRRCARCACRRPKRAWRKQVDIAPLASVSVGGDKKLDLQAMRITVQVEGLRARTLVDHIFHNPYAKVTEGKFRYALCGRCNGFVLRHVWRRRGRQADVFGDSDKLKGLSAAEIAAAKPEEVTADADPKYWADLKEGRIVAQEVATQVYEAETAKKVDPALVEELAPNTFEAKVYPIAADGYNRVLVAFEQTVPRVNGMYEYTFVVPKGDVAKVDFTLIAKNAAFAAAISSGSLATTTTETKGYLLHQWSQTATKEQPNTGGMLAVDLTPTNDNPAGDVLTGKDPTNANAFTFMRLHPVIAALQAKKVASAQAIFLLDTSASEGPGRFDVDMKLLTGILEKSSTIKEFQIVTFDLKRALAQRSMARQYAARAQTGAGFARRRAAGRGDEFRRRAAHAGQTADAGDRAAGGCAGVERWCHRSR